MAKKTPANTPSDKSTTYSTRLNDEQRALLEQAAEIEGVSASKFIRDAALKAAADTVNSSGNNERAIYAAVYSLADIVRNPKASVTMHSDDIDHSYEREISLTNGDVTLQPTSPVDDLYDDVFRPHSIRGQTLGHHKVQILLSIAESCPISFARAFRTAFSGNDDKPLEFSPKANPAKILED